MKKVAIVTTGHPPHDERIFDKIGKSLLKYNFDVFILVTTEDIQDEQETIKFIGKNFNTKKFPIKDKYMYLLKNLKKIDPDLIICCEAIPVILSFIHTLIQQRKIKSRIIYDVTEWYPENIFLKKKGIKKYFLLLAGHIINFLATNFSDYLFIGEELKLLRYRRYSPKKKYSIISYYPVLDFYKSTTQKFNGKKVTFGYAGVISVSRGLEIFYQILKGLKTHSRFDIGFILIGRFENSEEKKYLNRFKELGIDFQYFEWTDYKYFAKYLENAHICLDIRPPNKIYERSLPIKIFDYMALGKCIVASNYEPIRKIFEIANCGILVNPSDTEGIINKILELLKNPELIYQYGINGRSASEKFFNWSICEVELIKSIESLLI